MKRIAAAQAGILGLAFMFNITANAAAVEMRPIEMKPMETLKGVEAAPTTGKAAPKQLNFGKMNEKVVTAPANQPVLNGQTCSVEELASQLIKDTSVSFADALAALKFWGSRVTVGTCHGDAGGLVSYKAEARQNFLLAAVQGMNTLQSTKDYSAATAENVWAQALADAKHTDPASEVATVQALQNNCHILNLKTN